MASYIENIDVMFKGLQEKVLTQQIKIKELELKLDEKEEILK